ncbi:MAG: TetR/AcrR family transcriptional regulator [Pseudomonadota bacterium]
MTVTDHRRPRARNARPKIERAALELFIAEGVDAATTRNIADNAGVSEGALYRHYKGKDELALALFLDTHNRLGEMMIQAFTAPGDIELKVRLAVTAYCAFADEDWLSFSYHLVSLNRFLPHDVKREDDPVSVVEQLIGQLIENGDIPKGDPAILAAMSLGVVMQAGLNKIYNRLPGPFSQHVDVFTRTIMAILFQK